MPHKRLVAWSVVVIGLIGSFGIGCRSAERFARIPNAVSGVFQRQPSASDSLGATYGSVNASAAEAPASDPPVSKASVAKARTPVSTSAASAAPASTSTRSTPSRRSAQPISLQDQGDAAALVDAALASWEVLTDDQRTGDEQADAWQSYHRDLKALLGYLVEVKEFDASQAISLTGADGTPTSIRIELHGFSWTAQDFNQLHFAPGASHTQSKQASKLARYWQEPGLGIPLVALRIRPERKSYHGRMVPIAATAILRPRSSDRVAQVSHQSEIATLAFYNPLSTYQTQFGNRDYKLYRDLSAPLAHALGGVNRNNIQDFMCPDHQHDGVGLSMLAPYQPGKIPVVFIHGLLSDRLTWVDLVNDLRVTPWINDRYQIWAYQYPTGQSFLRSGGEMRAMLRQAIDDIDPGQHDEALSQMVLVGHSMGGLVTKLQITSSGSSVWDSIANRPVSHLAAPENVKAQIDSMFFFESQPFVRRAVFIGTPHLGSDWASSVVGRFGSTLVRQPKERVTALHDLMKNNPHVFIDQIHDRLPTSIDLLRPDSPLLLATYSLPVDRRVTMHSIIGTGKSLKNSVPADGVVPVANARHPNTVSERYIDTTHTHLPDHPQTTEEITKILREHLLAYDAGEKMTP